MKFLTLMSGSIPHKTHRTGLIPTIQQLEVQPHHVLPDTQARYHGDTCVRGAQPSGYLMYRDELFENVSSCPDMDESEKVANNTVQFNKLYIGFISSKFSG